MELQQRSTIFSGLSGINLPVKNRLLYPPEFQDKSRLEYYSHLFNSIEINSSFYKVPMPKTVSKWGELTPGNFRFTFKLWKQITHNKELAFNPADVEVFMNTINYAGDKKGCLLVQFPPSLQIAEFRQLDLLLHTISQFNTGNAWKVAVEFRHRSWYEEEVYRLLEQYNAGVVVHDLPASAAPLPEEASDFIYLRFHGPGGGYRGSYPDEFLSEYAWYIRDWISEGKEVYVYFNNTMGDAVNNLLTLTDFLKNIDSTA
jgi:uncharacterized protein YecE (DUF72 family)